MRRKRARPARCWWRGCRAAHGSRWGTRCRSRSGPAWHMCLTRVPASESEISRVARSNSRRRGRAWAAGRPIPLECDTEKGARRSGRESTGARGRKGSGHLLPDRLRAWDGRRENLVFKQHFVQQVDVDVVELDQLGWNVVGGKAPGQHKLDCYRNLGTVSQSALGVLVQSALHARPRLPACRHQTSPARNPQDAQRHRTDERKETLKSMPEYLGHSPNHCHHYDTTESRCKMPANGSKAMSSLAQVSGDAAGRCTRRREAEETRWRRMG